MKLTNLLSSRFAFLQNFLNASSIFAGVLFVASSRDWINLFRNLMHTATLKNINNASSVLNSILSYDQHVTVVIRYLRKH